MRLKGGMVCSESVPWLEATHVRFHQSTSKRSSTTDDVDLNAKLREWEKFYNLSRPHGAHNGKTPYEALKRLLE